MLPDKDDDWVSAVAQRPLALERSAEAFGSYGQVTEMEYQWPNFHRRFKILRRFLLDIICLTNIYCRLSTGGYLANKRKEKGCARWVRSWVWITDFSDGEWMDICTFFSIAMETTNPCSGPPSLSRPPILYLLQLNFEATLAVSLNNSSRNLYASDNISTD